MATKYPDGESPDELVMLRNSLMNWLVELGVATQEETAALEDAPGLVWDLAAQIWRRHVTVHSTQGGETCSASPCKVEFVSLALAEVCFYRDEIFLPNGDVRKALEELARSLRTQDGNIELLAAYGEKGERLYDQTRKSFKPEFLSAPETMSWYGCLEAVGIARRLSELAEGLAQQVAGQTVSQPARQRECLPSGRGRAKGSLLPAVWQQLRKGGIQWKEIAARVPGPGKSKYSDDGANRISSRSKKAGKCRSLLGWSEPAASIVKE
jgi:hypothetical protein